MFVETGSLHLCLILYTCGQGCDGNTWVQLFGGTSQYLWQYSVYVQSSWQQSTYELLMFCKRACSKTLKNKIIIIILMLKHQHWICKIKYSSCSVNNILSHCLFCFNTFETEYFTQIIMCCLWVCQAWKSNMLNHVIWMSSLISSAGNAPGK